MSQIIDPSVGSSLKEQFSLARAKKAYAAGVAGAITGAGTVSLGGIFADGKVDGAEVGVIISAVVGGFVLAFVGAWLPTNTAPDAPGTGDVLVKGDGLGDDGEPKHSA
ncbi:hypothetical protein EDF42_2172 [Curtobacterium sp. PhB172]|uniref:hypothetical protein n=1 Tax=Curtobacterium sp. PhB172 TaxID=2485196 RepID=UPI000F4BFBE6|nr:hypothetical protein [Curtobacterium sp. PhB172]ROS63918.1 hypothetical protein EDF42_2172 [Curtobacterium sp. PhB172]